MKSLFNDVLYDIPDEEHEKFMKWIDEVWTPNMEKGTPNDQGKQVRIPTNIRAVSFSIMLKEKHEKDWVKYIVKKDHE